MSPALDVILPVFLVIGAGWLAAKRGLMTPVMVESLMRFAQGIAVPLLLARSIGTLDLRASYDPALFASFYSGAFAAFALGCLGARLLGRPGTDAVAIGFAAMFSNSLLLGVPITERAWGHDALAGNFAIISIHAPVFYAVGIVAMEMVRGRSGGKNGGQIARQVIRAISHQPMVIGIVAGFVINITGNPLPEFAWAGINILAGAAIPCALFGLGGVLVQLRPEGDGLAIALVVVLSVLVHPAIAWGLGNSFAPLNTDQLRSAVMTAAMAPGVNAYLFSASYGAAPRVTASAVLVGTLASLVTIWCWLIILP